MRGLGICVAIVLFALTSQSSADTYTHSRSGTPFGGPIQESSSAPFDRAVQYGPDPADVFKGQVVTRGGPGGVGASIIGTYEGPFNGYSGNVGAGSQAQGSIIFSGPPGLVTTSLNVELEGALSCGPTAPPSITGADMRVNFIVAVGQGDVGSVNGRVVHPSSPDPFFQSHYTSTFAGLDGTLGPTSLTVDDSGTSQTFQVFTGTPYDVSLLLSVSYAGSNQGFKSYTLDFASTGSFATSGPVFNLPAGYTANGFGIVDNQYIVPEPAGMSLMLAAAAMLFARRRRS